MKRVIAIFSISVGIVFLFEHGDFVAQRLVLLPELVELPHAVRVEEAHHGDEDEDGPEVFLPYEGQAESFEFLSHSFGA